MADEEIFVMIDRQSNLISNLLHSINYLNITSLKANRTHLQADNLFQLISRKLNEEKYDI